MSVKKVILDVLNDAGKALRGRVVVDESDGKVGRASVYVHLSSLEEAGLVRSRYEDGKGEGASSPEPRAREYEITSKGRAARLRGDW